MFISFRKLERSFFLNFSGHLIFKFKAHLFTLEVETVDSFTFFNGPLMIVLLNSMIPLSWSHSNYFTLITSSDLRINIDQNIAHITSLWAIWMWTFAISWLDIFLCSLTWRFVLFVTSVTCNFCGNMLIKIIKLVSYCANRLLWIGYSKIIKFKGRKTNEVS